MYKPLLLLMVLFLFLLPLQSSVAACNTTACLEAKMLNHPATRIATWQRYLALPLAQRIAAAPVELIDYIGIDNALSGYTSQVSASTQAESYVALVQAAISPIPQQIKELVETKLAGIFIVEGLGTTGYTERILDARGESVAAIIVLDSGLLDKSANDWASWRLSTAFISNPLYKIRVTLESPAEDTQINAIQFILLHEIGHVLSLSGGFHPDWWLPVEQISIKDYPFVQLSWQVSDDARYISLFERDFPLRQSIVFYRQPRLKAEQMVASLSNLQQTNYVSLYASTSPYEDLAETFALYVHSELMQKPYSIEALVSGAPAVRVNNCFSARCSDKQQFIHNWLAGANPEQFEEQVENRTK